LPGSLTTIWSTLQRLGLSQALRAAEQDRPDVAAHRHRWRRRFMDPTAFIFLDETGATTNMIRRHGWGARRAAPHSIGDHPPSSPVCAQTGLIASRMLDRPITGQGFRAYVEQFLAPSLSPGDVVVMNNLAAHPGPKRQRGDRRRRRQHPLSAALLAGPELHRANVRQAERDDSEAPPPATPPATPSVGSSTPSAPLNATTIFTTQAMRSTKKSPSRDRRGQRNGIKSSGGHRGRHARFRGYGEPWASLQTSLALCAIPHARFRARFTQIM
jgi:hypothetical protein